MSAGMYQQAYAFNKAYVLDQSICLLLYRRNTLTLSLHLHLHLQVGVVGSGQGMTDYKKVARHDFNPDAE